MADRSFFVKLNLDDMAASLDALDSTEERGQWLEGFRVGSRGSKPRGGWPEAKMLGHEFGMECWERAEEYREKQAEKGRASGESRRKRTGSEPETNHGSTTVQPQLNQTPNREATNQKPEAINHKPITENEKPTPQPPKEGTSHLVDDWNVMVKGTNLPQARLTESRSRLIATRIKGRGWTDDFKIAAAFIAKSDFHRGSNDRGWVASIDYLLQAGKATEIAEKANASVHRPLNRIGTASVRAATDQALIDQLEEQRNASSQSRTEPTAADTRWFDDAAASQAAGA